MLQTSREPNLEFSAISGQLVEETKHEVAEGLMEYLGKIFTGDDVNARLQQITARWPRNLPMAVFVTDAQARAWVVLNLLLSLPENISGDEEVFPLRRSRELMNSLIKRHVPQLSHMLFWRNAGQDPDVLNYVLDFITTNPFGLKVIPQGFMHWVALFLTQNPAPIQQLLLGGSAELEAFGNSIVVMTARSPMNTIICPHNNSDTLTLAVKINLSEPLMLLGYFTNAKGESSAGLAEQGESTSIKVPLTPGDLYLAVHSACSGYINRSENGEAPVSIKIYTANAGNLGTIFADLVSGTNYGRVEVFNFDSRDSTGIEVVNRESGFEVKFLRVRQLSQECANSKKKEEKTKAVGKFNL